MTDSKGVEPHVSAAEILAVAASVAQKTFGPYARTELGKMGVVSSETFGNLIFGFIQKGILSQMPMDRIEDFRRHSSFDDFLEIA